MNRSTQISFRTKLLALVALISGLAIVLSMGAMATLDYVWHRTAAVHSIASHADVIASNSAAAVVFNDQDAAAETLKALRAIPGITAANIYDQAGHVFATYKDPSALPKTMTDTQHLGHAFHGYFLDLSRGIDLDGERVGIITLRYDMRLVHDRVLRDVLVSIACSLTAILVAFLLAVKLQKTLTRPVVELEATARQVAQNRDYTVRARKYSNDELGSLTESFNEMLGQVQLRDSALAEARDRLEDEVAQRTCEYQVAKTDAEQAAESLAESEARIRTILEHAPVGVITFEPRGTISLMNPAAERIFGCPHDRLDGVAINDLLAEGYAVREDGVVIQHGHGSGAAPLGQSAEITGLRRDGKEVPIHVLLSRTNLAGRTVFTAIIRDISERKRAEKEKEHLNRRLLEESRRSGMAEIATGVLHNVGNVLTSINVSVNLLSDRVGRSKVSSLVKAAGLIREHADDLPRFISEDERGQHLPAFIMQAAGHLDNEMNELASELASLIERTQHVQEIINTQQSYATAGGVTEKIALADVLQDALRINDAGLERHGVKLRLEVGELPPVIVDKHKLLQVLVNLISNAKYAADKGKPDRWVLVRLNLTEPDNEHVRVEVVDNGIGIAGENLIRIFNHGFTTREEGHGYGLHNAALAAKEMGGSLTAESPGPGGGATFILTIPIHPDKRREEARRESAA